MNYWLIKSEPESYSIDDLKRDKKTEWTGVRNYQARNFMRDEMKKGDLALFYHSNAEPPGVAGIARVCKETHPDKTAFDERSKYFDDSSSPDNPRWFLVDFEFVKKFDSLIPLEELKMHPSLSGMLLLKRGQRLSVQPVDKKHFEIIEKLAAK
ncbi:EVE domain-containing protein [bacterium]|nr:EVE domain-containing protein [bacterium]